MGKTGLAPISHIISRNGLVNETACVPGSEVDLHRIALRAINRTVNGDRVELAHVGSKGCRVDRPEPFLR